MKWSALFAQTRAVCTIREHLFYSAMKSTQTKLDAIEFDSNWIDFYLQRRLLNPWNKSSWISINGTDFETNFASQGNII